MFIKFRNHNRITGSRNIAWDLSTFLPKFLSKNFQESHLKACEACFHRLNAPRVLNQDINMKQIKGD